MVEAWIFTIFCLVVSIPIARSERSQNARSTKYAKRNIQSRVQRIQKQSLTA